MSFVINSRSLIPASRTRIYIIGVNLKKVTVSQPMSTWHAQITEAVRRVAKHRQDIDVYLLKDDSDQLQSYLTEMEVQRRDLWDNPEEVHGKSWKRCFDKHQRVRQAMARLHDMHIPSCTEFCTRPRTPRWALCLTPRSWDLVSMHAFVATHPRGLNVSDSDFKARKYIWDTSNNVDFERKKHPNTCGVAPCFLLSHDYWLTWKERPITGFEILLTQGFPPTMVTSWRPPSDGPGDGDDLERDVARDKLLHKLDLPGHQLSDRRLRMLGGNTQSVPIMGILLGVVLANVQWNPTEKDKAVRARGRGAGGAQNLHA